MENEKIFQNKKLAEVFTTETCTADWNIVF